MQSYIIGPDDGGFLAVHQLTRRELARGGATEVLGKAIAAAGEGGHLLLLPGVYLIERTLELPGGFTLSGSGKGTKLRAAPGFTGESMVGATEVDHIVIENLSLSPANPDGADVGIVLHQCGDATLQNVAAVGFRQYGIVLREHSFLCRISACTTAGNGKAGVLLKDLTWGGRGGDYVPNSLVGCTSYGERGSGYEVDHALCANFSGCQVYQAQAHGFWLHSTSNSICISGCRVFQCMGAGVLVQDTHEANVSSNIFCWNKSHGIELDHAIWSSISANNVIDSGGTTGPRVHGIYLHTDTRSAQVTGNTVFNWDGHLPMENGIREEEDCRFNNILANNINYYAGEEGVVCKGQNSHQAQNLCTRDFHPHPEREPFSTSARGFNTKEFSLEKIQKIIGDLLT